MCLTSMGRGPLTSTRHSHSHSLAAIRQRANQRVDMPLRCDSPFHGQRVGTDRTLNVSESHNIAAKVLLAPQA